MLNALIRRFVPNCDETDRPAVRTAYGVLSGAMGIAFNLLLFAIKLPIGLISGSIAITSDAFNNISDMGASLVTVIGARVANRHADADHPFGHGRYEYIAALTVGFMILLVGVELLKESVGKFWSPSAANVSVVQCAILACSILIKLYMFYYNRKIAEKVNSSVMRAAASDSINDVLVTGGVVLSAVIARFVSWPIDAITGCIVSLLILYSGFSVTRETVGLLLGGKPDPTLIRNIRAELLKIDHVRGIHDLIIHDYGPGRAMASVHVEVARDIDIVHLHEDLDEAEHRISEELGVPIVIHADPIDVDDPALARIRNEVADILRDIDPCYAYHDLRRFAEDGKIRLQFDVVVPPGIAESERDRVKDEIERRMRAINGRYDCDIRVDSDYTA